MAAHKDRLIQAADLLGMTPDDLLSLLDPPIFPTSLVGIARERQARILDRPRVDPDDARTLARAFRELDIHLSAGGELPAEWRRDVAAMRARDDQPTLRDRYWQCNDTCTVDCGACKGAGRCPVWLGHAGDEGGEHRCAGPASHPGRQHDARRGTWQR